MTKTVFGVEKLLATSVLGPAESVRIDATNRVFQANLTPGAADASAVVDIEVSLDNEHWLKLATINLDAATPVDGFTSSATWMYVRANLISLPNGASSVTVFVGV